MKLPFTFGTKFVFRLLLPGFILAIGLYPLVMKITGAFGVAVDNTVFMSLSTIICGWLLVVLDMQIYMLFEGRRFWLSPLRYFCINAERRRLATLLKTIRRTRPRKSKPTREKLYRKLRAKLCVNKFKKVEPSGVRSKSGRQRKIERAKQEADRLVYLEASVDCRAFPKDIETGQYTVKSPTRLGNLILSYEEYPLVVYGLDTVFFWPRIWVNLNKDLREELDEAQSIADSTLYTCFTLYILSGLAIFYWFMSYINLPFETLVIKPNILLASGFVAFIFAYILYRISFHTHARYGDLFKAAFDMYSNNLSFIQAEKELEELIRKRPKKEQNVIIWRYLNNYRIKDPVTKQNLTPQKWKEKNKAT